MIKFIVIFLFALCHLTAFAQCESYEHDDIFEASWLSCTQASHPALLNDRHWIEYDLSYIRKLGNAHFWNYNISGEESNGAKHLAIYTSLDRQSWNLIAHDTLGMAPGTNGYNGEVGLYFNGNFARYVLIAAIDNYGGACTGLSEIRIEFDENFCSDIESDIVIRRTLCQDNIEISAEVIPSGGIAPFTYLWSTGSTSSMANGLTTGSHQVVIIDASNCLIEYDILIEETNLSDQDLELDTIPSGIYLDDTLSASGSIVNDGEVFLFYEENSIFEPGFIIEQNSNLYVEHLDCLIDTTQAYPIRNSSPENWPSDLNRGYIGLGNDSYVLTNASSEESSALAAYTITGTGNLDIGAAARFLSQASLGYNREMIDQVSNMGIREWLDWQTRVEHESYFNHFTHNVRFDQQFIRYWLDFHRSWWHNTLTGQEYLRERVSFALSQIFVISSKSFLLNYGDGMTEYYDMLMNHSFGNYRDLLYDVTMNPMMGFYLSHLNNPKSDLSINQFPDENYAREILQLFSIGLYELNIDGTRKKDAQGDDIPSYSNDHIMEFAKIFTGLGFSDLPFGTTGNSTSGRPYTIPMIMHDEFHEPGQKILLNQEVVDSGQTGIEDINDAIDNVFNHPNVGPFLATRLIQRLVKSEPSPNYVQRVAEVFNNNGSGVRGDLKAVIYAILLDEEARDCQYMNESTHGMLREPLIRLIHLMKAFEINSTTNTFYALGETIQEFTQQAPLGAPSVFNFYQSDFSAPGLLSDQGVRSPEFGILDSYTSIGYVNLIDSLSSNLSVLDLEEGVASLSFSEEIIASSDINSLINLLDIKLTYGHLSDNTRQILVQALNLVGTDPNDRIKMAIYIIANSPDFTVLK